MSLQLGNYPDPAASVPFHYGHADLRKTSGCVQTRPDVSDDPIGGHFDLTASDVIDQIALFVLGDRLVPLRQFAELLRNSFGGGKGDSGVAHGSPTELVADCVDGPVHSPPGGFDDGSGSGASISMQVGRIER